MSEQDKLLKGLINKYVGGHDNPEHTAKYGDPFDDNDPRSLMPTDR
jgi:hypothetical protein